MPSILVISVVTLALVTAVLGGLESLLRRSPGRVTLGAALLTGLAVLALSIAGGLVLITGERPAETATAVGYLIGIVFVMPLGAAWAVADRGRWSGYVLAVAGVTVAVMAARLVMLMRGVHA